MFLCTLSASPVTLLVLQVDVLVYESDIISLLGCCERAHQRLCADDHDAPSRPGGMPTLIDTLYLFWLRVAFSYGEMGQARFATRLQGAAGVCAVEQQGEVGQHSVHHGPLQEVFCGYLGTRRCRSRVGFGRLVLCVSVTARGAGGEREVYLAKWSLFFSSERYCLDMRKMKSGRCQQAASRGVRRIRK